MSADATQAGRVAQMEGLAEAFERVNALVDGHQQQTAAVPVPSEPFQNILRRMMEGTELYREHSHSHQH